MAPKATQEMPDLQSPRVRELHDYWLSKRGERVAPARGDIDPSEIKPLLPYVLIADLLTDPVRVQFRLAGTQVCQSFGFNITGRWLHELDLTSNIEFWVAQYARLIASHAPVFGRTQGICNDVEMFRSEWALLPLARDGHTPNQSLEIEDWINRNPTARYDDPTITWRTVALG